MPTQLGTTLNPDLLGFLEKGLADEAAAVYAVNPTAAEIAVAEDLGLAFPEVLAVIGFAALVGIAAAWLLSKFNERPVQPQPDPSKSRTWRAPSGSTIAVYATAPNLGNITITGCPSGIIEASDLQDNPDFPGDPIYVKLIARNGSASYTSSGGEQPLRITHCDVCPGTTAPPGPIPPSAPDFPPLTPTQEGKIRAIGKALLPPPKPTKPPVTQDDLQPLLDGLKKAADAAKECCDAEKADLAKIKDELKKILDRVKKVSQNIGLPDLDGNNAGLPSLWDATDASDMVTCFRLIDKSLGGWTSIGSVQVASVPKSYQSIKEGLDTLADRIGFDIAEPTPTPTDPALVAANLQVQIRRKDVEQADASFHVGYADTGKRHDVLKIVYTDTSKFKRRQNASITIPNPLPTLNAATIKNALPERTLGSWFCTLACGDGTRITGWFVSPVIGNQALSALARLTRTDKALPVDFTATERAATTPAIAGTLLTATSYVWNRLGNDGNYTLVKGKL
jgi:hypothetical protein